MWCILFVFTTDGNAIESNKNMLKTLSAVVKTHVVSSMLSVGVLMILRFACIIDIILFVFSYFFLFFLYMYNLYV